MKRPPELRCLKLDPYEYKLIGEIVVLSGILEAHLKDLPLFLKAAKSPAFMAHLNFLSVCDIDLALLPEFVPHPPLRKALEKTIKECRTVYAERNQLVHGPFFPHPDGTKGTFRVSYRGKEKFSGWIFDRHSLHDLLSRLSEAFEDLQVCIVALQRSHGELRDLDEPPQPRTRSRKASPQTP